MRFYKSNRLIKIIIFSLIVFFEILFPVYLTKLIDGETPNLPYLELPPVIIFDSLWVFVSYIAGRYSDLNINKPGYLNKLLLIIKQLFITSTIITIFLLSLKVIALNNVFNSKNIPSLLIIFTSLAIVKEVILIKILNAASTGKPLRIIFLGESSELEMFEKVIKEYNFKKSLKFEIRSSNNAFKSNPDQVVISKKSLIKKNEQNSLRYFLSKGVQIFSVSKWCEFELSCLPVELMEEENFIDSKIFSNNRDIEFRIKRLADILLSLFLLISTAPIIAIASFLIWLEDKGPIFYNQTREGLLGQNIKIYKLRTMVVNAEKDGPKWAAKNDQRITPIGKILRRMRIDELPQLISVIKGELSLIGPRPERPGFNELLIKEIPNYSQRNLIRPGLSGWAQVNYPYGASKKDSKIKLSYDIYYLLNFSLLLDLLILFKTIRTVFNGLGSNPMESK